MRTSRNRILTATLVALIAIVSYFGKKSINPITGEEQYVSLTPEQEIALGLQSLPEIAAQFGGFYADEEAQTLVKRVGQKLVAGTHASSSPYQFDFHVLADEQTVNAFALPGGQIFITVALLSRLKTEDQLAGVLGHEIGHVIGRHSAERMAQQELTQGLIQAGQIATNDPNMIASYVAQMVTMKFGREDELESDEFGVHYLHETGYDTHGMIEVMEILEAASGGSNVPEFQSTHPSPENRIEKLEEIIATL